jgi:hypothetical protein
MERFSGLAVLLTVRTSADALVEVGMMIVRRTLNSLDGIALDENLLVSDCFENGISLFATINSSVSLKRSTNQLPSSVPADISKLLLPFSTLCRYKNGNEPHAHIWDWIPFLQNLNRGR